MIHKAAKQAFDELQITKLPSLQSLYEEFHQLAVQKKHDYAEYRQIRKEKEELLIAKRTIETILNIDRQKEQEKEQEKGEKKHCDKSKCHGLCSVKACRPWHLFEVRLFCSIRNILS